MQFPTTQRKFPPSLLAAAIAMAVMAPASADLLDNSLARIDVTQLQGSQLLMGFDVAALPNDRLAVVWAVQDNSASDSILMQRYSRQGSPIGNRVTVYEHASTESGSLKRPVIAADDSGKMVIGWNVKSTTNNFAPECESTKNIMVATVDAADTVQMVSFPSVDLTDSCGVKVAMDDDGDFAVAWGKREGYNDFGVRVMTFNALGTSQSNEIELETSAIVAPALAMQGDGGFMVSWPAGTLNDSSLFAQRFADINATFAGSEFRLDNNPNRAVLDQYFSHIAADKNGGYVAIWVEEDNEDGNPGRYYSFEVHGQRWMADGSAGDALQFGGVDLLGKNGTQYYSRPSISADAEGNVIAAWSNEIDHSDQGLATDYFNNAVYLAAGESEPKDPVTVLGKGLGANRVYAGMDARVSAGEKAAVGLWTDDQTTLQARFMSLPEPTDSNNPISRSSSGGPLSCLVLLLIGLFAGVRSFRHRHSVGILTESRNKNELGR